ncbi:MAG: vitamin B12-dependent ribonucleotide reductase, partial [Planctomycetota bacterium]
QQVFDLTEPVTSSFVANGVTVHNCSEYMFLDDTACNLASLNLIRFFDAETGSFDLDSYKHAVRIWTIVLEISVLMASFPSQKIAELSYRYRTLGLGYANLGAVLMQSGIAYDSDKARAICGALSAIMTGESYATSAEMAKEHGPFPGFADDRDNMLRVIKNHRRAAYADDTYEDLTVLPVPIDAGAFDSSTPLLGRDVLNAARHAWDRALDLGEQHGYRNAQATVIAPTGTIGLLMDCDTTGVEPDFALVKFKKLAGGGYFKIANAGLVPALLSLGYDHEQADDVVKFVLGTLTLNNAPHVNRTSLKDRGFTDDELDAIEQGLPSAFELPFAFSPWSLSAETLGRLGVTDDMKADPAFNLLRHLGFTRKQIDEAGEVICGRGTVEGAPHLKAEHYDVFDCANKCGKTGTRYIAAGGHIKMMAAAQPFISGAISKTINLPNEATVEEVQDAYQQSWSLGLKANALYRDGSKLSQPLNTKSDADEEEDDELNVEAGIEEVADAAALAADQLTNLEHVEPRTIEKIVERVVHRPLRRKLSDTREAKTHKFDIAGHEGYITVGLYDDGQPGELFITMNKEGSTVGGLMDTVATLASLALQYGVKIEDLVRKFEHVRFEPAGMTRNRDIPMAKSLVDYIFRWLGMEFIPGYRAANSPNRSKPVPTPAPAMSPHAEAPASDSRPTNGNGHAHPQPHSNGNGSGNGHAIVKPDTRTTPTLRPTEAEVSVESVALVEPAMKVRNRLAVSSDPLSLAGSAAQSDAPACDVCGSITVRSGTCYKCLNCGNSMGCS